MDGKVDFNKFPNIRNRKEAREFAKVLRRHGKNEAEIKEIIELTKQITKIRDVEKLPKFKECLLEGDKVKLNVEKIRQHPDWDKLQPAYKEFVEGNAGVVFTVEYDEDYADKSNLVGLKEAPDNQKWLFWDGDLFVLDERDGQFKELYMIYEEGGVV